MKAANFMLSMSPDIFESDLSYPSNTIMKVMVESGGFSANATMDIDVRELARFAFDLTKIYETLSGEARIEEPYGMHMYILFVGNGRVHIAVKGYFHKGNRVGNEQVLEFENDIDQTCLKEFGCDLFSAYGKYMNQ